MSKAYRVDMNIDISDLHPSGGLLMQNPVAKTEEEALEILKKAGIEDPKPHEIIWDARGFKERPAPQIFEMIVAGALQGANQRVSYDQLKGFRKVGKTVKDAVVKGEFITNKTEIDMIKNSIRGNSGWPNTDEMFNVLERVMDKLDKAELIDENPTSNGQGADPQQEKQPS